MFLEQQAIDYFRQTDFILPVLGHRQGEYSSRVLGRNQEFEQYNAYRPGDNIRDLDWKVYGRSHRLFIRKYGADLGSKIRLILDTSRSMDWEDKAERARKTAAILIYLLQKQKCRVSLYSLSPGLLSHPVSQSGLETELANLRYQGTMDLSSLKKENGWYTILVSDLWAARDSLAYLVEQQINLFQILTPSELTFSVQGNVELRDVETGHTQQLVASTVRNLYQEKIQDWIDSIRRHCFDAGLLYGLCDGSEPYYVQLRRFLASASAGRYRR